MPKTSGPELALQLGAARPDMKVIFMSGYTDNAMLHHGARAQGVAFLPKPIGLDSLTRKIREVLEASARV